MPLNRKNAEVETLAAELAGRMGETKAEAIRVALLERKARPGEARPADSTLRAFLERHWATLPAGLTMPTHEEEAEIFGEGPHRF